MLADTLNDPNQTAEKSPLPKWNIGTTDFGIFIALLFSSMVVASTAAGKIAAWLLDADPDAERPLLVTHSENLGMQLGMLLAFIGFSLITRDPPKPRRAGFRRSAIIGLKWLMISYPIMIGVNLLWKLALMALGFEQVTQDPVKLVQEGGAFAERLLIYLMIIVVAPICEEVVFRGGVFRFLHHRLSLVGAAGLSAFFFAAIHFNLYSFAPLFVIGVTLALAYRETGSILSAIVFHSVFNSLNLCLILLFPDLS